MGGLEDPPECDGVVEGGLSSFHQSGRDHFQLGVGYLFLMFGSLSKACCENTTGQEKLDEIPLGKHCP